MSHDQGRALQALDDIGHGKGFTRAGYSKEDLIMMSILNIADNLINSSRLIAGGLKRRLEIKFTLHLIPFVYECALWLAPVARRQSCHDLLKVKSLVLSSLCTRSVGYNEDIPTVAD